MNIRIIKYGLLTFNKYNGILPTFDIPMLKKPIKQWGIIKKIIHACIFILGVYLLSIIGILMSVIFMIIYYYLIYAYTDFDTFNPRILNLWFKLKSDNGFIIDYVDDDKTTLGIISKFTTNNIYYIYDDINLTSYSIHSDVFKNAELFEKIENIKEKQIAIKEKYTSEYHIYLEDKILENENKVRDEIYKKNLIEIL